MENKREIFLQNKNKEYITKRFGNEQWIQIGGKQNLNGADATFWCGLIEANNINILFNDVDWDVSPTNQSVPGFVLDGEGCCYYSNVLDNGFESIVFYRDFYGVKPDYVELSQEFILLNNLRYDSKNNSYFAMCDNGESDKVVEYLNDTTILINMRYLRKYATAKQKVIVLYFEIKVELDDCSSINSLLDLNTEYRNDSLYYHLWSGEIGFHNTVFSILMGKKIIKPSPLEKCGYWPFDSERNYEEFIIGTDEAGEDIYYTCNPNKLRNYFGANPSAPMYLTPVFFKREVLQKYISQPELYNVRDGYLACKSLWGIEIDNHYKDCISVYLGDLGRDLPESEQTYWKSYNIVSDKGLSKIAFQRDFLNINTNSNMVDHVFQCVLKDTNDKWELKYGWKLFLPLTQEDYYNTSGIHIPLTNSQPEFDLLVLSLVKTIIDSLNEKELAKVGVLDDDKSIAKLEKWLNGNGAMGFEKHISFLRDLQELRSSGTGHRKGKTYSKIAKKFGLDKKNRTDVFEEILERANEFLQYLESFIDNN